LKNKNLPEFTETNTKQNNLSCVTNYPATVVLPLLECHHTSAVTTRNLEVPQILPLPSNIKPQSRERKQHLLVRQIKTIHLGNADLFSSSS
jgi:hypothetical protein